MSNDPTDTFRFYVEFSWAGTWAIEPIQGLPIGHPATPEELGDLLRQLADKVEESKAQNYPRIVYTQPVRGPRR